ncbi:neuropeptide-like protein C4orf48 homolog [Ornithorhynchus anatinus]|uniref:neuropeptide-like protein C4orf48 homolog n=1 Tax=Ornithorhynchus anatinus TaxID=9258 RepID=UPI0010A8998C|nr:neuropeptide-like protein C4orf48 homolog [Ornithorhynchus anatinus]
MAVVGPRSACLGALVLLLGSGLLRGVQPARTPDPAGTPDPDLAGDKGSVIPAESRPCVDCHAFEFMQRALQDLKKTAYNLDSRTETLLLHTEERALCDCFPAMH